MARWSHKRGGQPVPCAVHHCRLAPWGPTRLQSHTTLATLWPVASSATSPSSAASSSHQASHEAPQKPERRSGSGGLLCGSPTAPGSSAPQPAAPEPQHKQPVGPMQPQWPAGAGAGQRSGHRRAGGGGRGSRRPGACFRHHRPRAGRLGWRQARPTLASEGCPPLWPGRNPPALYHRSSAVPSPCCFCCVRRSSAVAQTDHGNQP